MPDALSGRLRVAVLVSLGRHRVSNRAGRAPRDARALELALGLENAEVQVLHAGDPAQPALRDYLGMGIPGLTVLDIPLEADAIPSLEDHLRPSLPDIILTGSRGSGGEDSGLLPYMLAKTPALPLIPDVVALYSEQDSATAAQALPDGGRRMIRSRLPFLATVPTAAPPPRQFAYGPARRGKILPLPVSLVIDAVRADWQAARAQNRLKFPDGKDDGGTQRGRVLKDLAPEQAAAAIHHFLVEQEIVPPLSQRPPAARRTEAP